MATFRSNDAPNASRGFPRSSQPINARHLDTIRLARAGLRRQDVSYCSTRRFRRRIAAIWLPREPAAWPRSGSPSLPEILLRQHLAFFHRGLIEGVHAEEPRGDDGLQHEMHEQLAQARLVELVDMDGAHGTTVLGQRLGGGAAFGGGEVADGLAGEIRLARELGEIGGHARTAAGGGGSDDGDQLVARAGDVELQLAMLVNRPERGDGRGALAVLAQALGPQLHVPAREAFEPV